MLSGVIVSFDGRGIERSGFVVIRSVLSSSRFDMTRSPRYRRREIFTGERASGQRVFGGVMVMGVSLDGHARNN